MLAAMKKDLHNRLWNAQERWFALRAKGATKRELKLRGIKEAGDPNLHLRSLIFTGATKRAIEETLKSFVEFAHERFGAQRLEDIGKREFRAFIEDGIARGLAATTLEAQCSHLVKFGCLTGQAQSAIALGRKLRHRIGEVKKSGSLPRSERLTPSPETAKRAIQILRSWDQRHEARTGTPRPYHLVARLQLETSARSLSVTNRLTRDCLKGGNLIEVIGKGGRTVLAPVSPELYEALAKHLENSGEPLADRDGYRMAWRRAIQTARGKATGTHGLRRRAAREFYSEAYARMTALGMSPEEASHEARAEAVERLGHSRDRTDQAACYLGPAA
jgi:integrase